MVPSTLAAVVFFFILAAPGLTADLLRDQRVSLKEDESAFREFGRIVLGSTSYVILASAIALSIAAATSWFTWAQLGTIFENQVMTGRFSLPLVGAGAGIITLACLLAVGHHYFLKRRDSDLLLRGTAWDQVLRLDAPPGTTPVIRVFTADGMVYRGQLSSYTQAKKFSDRELVLRQPLAIERNDQAWILDYGWQRMSIDSSSIKGISVAYAPSPEKDEEMDYSVVLTPSWIDLEIHPTNTGQVGTS